MVAVTPGLFLGGRVKVEIKVRLPYTAWDTSSKRTSKGD